LRPCWVRSAGGGRARRRRAYWRHHEEKELARNHEALYARGELPKLTPPSPSRRKRRAPPLRVVK
jgi:hypothetical protein